MVSSCSAINCTVRESRENRANGISLHKFPSDKRLRMVWAVATKRQGLKKGSIWVPPKFASLCSRHFAPSDFHMQESSRKCLKQGAIPTRFDFSDANKRHEQRGRKKVPQTEGKPSSLMDVSNPDWVPSIKMGDLADKHSTRRRKRKLNQDCDNSVINVFENSQGMVKIIKLEQIIKTEEPLNSSIDICVDEDSQSLRIREHKVPVVASTQTDFSSDSIRRFVKCKDLSTQTEGSYTIQQLEHCKTLLQLELNERMSEIYELREKLSYHEFHEDEFNDDEAVRFYTGFKSASILKHVFHTTRPQVEDNSRRICKLTEFQEFVLTLMRMKLSLSLQDLAFRFAVSRKSASRAIKKWMDILDQEAEGDYC